MRKKFGKRFCLLWHCFWNIFLSTRITIHASIKPNDSFTINVRNYLYDIRVCVHCTVHYNKSSWTHEQRLGFSFGDWRRFASQPLKIWCTFIDLNDHLTVSQLWNDKTCRLLYTRTLYQFTWFVGVLIRRRARKTATVRPFTRSPRAHSGNMT